MANGHIVQIRKQKIARIRLVWTRLRVSGITFGPMLMRSQ